MPPSPFLHHALSYRSEEELLAVALPFLHEGASAGEPTLVGGDARQQRLLRDELGEEPGITWLDPALYRDGLSALHAYHRVFARLVRDGAQRIRILGGVPHDPWPGWFRYEAAANDVFARFPVVAICAHDERTAPERTRADVERTHPHLVSPSGSVSRSARYREPATLLAERAREDADPLEAVAPSLVLADPLPDVAGRSVASLARATRLDPNSVDALRLSVAHVVGNAVVHGAPPVRLRAWAAPDRVVATISDAGTGPADPYVALLPRDPDLDAERANALHLISQALTDVAMFTDAHGFTVRLVERCRR